MFFWFDINNVKKVSASVKAEIHSYCPYYLFFRDFSSYCKSILHN